MFIGQEEQIAELASVYVKSFIPSILMQFYISSYVKFLSSQQIYYIVLVIYFIFLCLHSLWCYIFYIYLDLSIIGLGISTGITHFLILISIYAYVTKNKLELDVPFKNISWKEYKFFFSTALECSVLSSMDTIGFDINTFMAVLLPKTELDANICVANIYDVFFAISVGFCSSLNTLVGNYMGANRPKVAQKYSINGIFLNFFINMTISSFCLISDFNVAKFYIDDKDILVVCGRLLRIGAVSYIFDSIQLQMSAVLKGIGKAFIGMCIGLSFWVVLQITFVYLILTYTNMGVDGMWYSMLFICFLNSLAYFIILKTSDWDKLALEASRNVEDSLLFK